MDGRRHAQAFFGLRHRVPPAALFRLGGRGQGARVRKQALRRRAQVLRLQGGKRPGKFQLHLHFRRFKFGQLVGQIDRRVLFHKQLPRGFEGLSGGLSFRLSGGVTHGALARGKVRRGRVEAGVGLLNARHRFDDAFIRQTAVGVVVEQRAVLERLDDVAVLFDRQAVEEERNQVGNRAGDGHQAQHHEEIVADGGVKEDVVIGRYAHELIDVRNHESRGKRYGQADEPRRAEHEVHALAADVLLVILDLGVHDVVVDNRQRVDERVEVIEDEKQVHRLVGKQHRGDEHDVEAVVHQQEPAVAEAL